MLSLGQSFQPFSGGNKDEEELYCYLTKLTVGQILEQDRQLTRQANQSRMFALASSYEQ